MPQAERVKQSNRDAINQVANVTSERDRMAWDLWGATQREMR